MGVYRLKISNEYVELIQKLNLRIDGIEKLLQLLLINDLVDDSEYILHETKVEVDSNLKTIIIQYGLEIEGFQSINEIEVFVINVPATIKISIKDLKQIHLMMKNNYPAIEPLFLYDSINGMQRKRILQENISFGVKGRELHVSCGEGKRK